MTQSPEYPDLKWMPPASWTNANRTSVQLIVIHDTEGSETATSAEDGASYDQRRTDGTSTHYFHDTNSTVQCVRTEDIAHAARTEGNKRGIQHELCGKAGQGVIGWADPGSTAELHLAAKQCARDAKKWGIPVRHLTIAQIVDGDKGFCGHADITRAFPQDKGTHTDPGPDFPWSTFLDMVRAEMEDFPMDQATFNKLMAGYGALTLDTVIEDKANPGRTVGDVLRDAAKLRGVLVGDAKDTANAAIPATAPISLIIAAATPPPAGS
jgi:N-acetylmuramoyl-L-alanine amidase